MPLRRRGEGRAGRAMLIVAALLVLPLLLAACGEPDPRLSAPEDNAGAAPEGAILFVAGHDVFVWDGEVRRITEEALAASPRWSPTGDRFVYVQLHDDPYSDLVIADRQGTVLQQLTDNRPDAAPGTQQFARSAYWAMDPIWSPSGQQIAFASDRGGWEPGPGEARLSDPMYLWYWEGPDVAPYLLPASERIGLPQGSPTFAPDGLNLAFVVRTQAADGQRSTEIWTIDLETGETAVLVSGAEPAYDPAWSLDGRDIAFIRRGGAGNDVWIAPVEGGEPYRLTDIGTCAAPVWSPDGHFLAFFTLNDERQFQASYVEIGRGADGRLSASEPKTLFTADDIDVTSGMSWTSAG